MAIKTNHTNETLSPDSGVLVISADGALKLPIGNITKRPTGVKGLVRVDEETAAPEYYDGITWQLVSNKEYVDNVNENLQNQINSIISNIDPAALDSLAEIVQAFQDADLDITTAITSLQTALETETQARIDGDTDLQLNIDNETTARTSADTILQNNINQLETNIQSQIDYFVSNLDTDTLDSLAEIVQAFQDADLDITTAITSLQTALGTETQARIDGDAALDERVTTVEGQVNGKIGDLTTLTTDDNSTIVGAINELDLKIDLEHQHHIDADALIQSELDLTQVSAGLETDGSYLINGTNYIDTATSLKSADILLDAAIKATETNLSTTLTNLTLDDLSDVAITTPTDGQVLVYDVTTGQFRTQTQAMSVITKTFTADGVTYDFDMGTSVSSVHNIVVTVNGIQQEPIYSFVLTNGTTVTFDEAPEAGDKIQVKILRTSAQTDRPRPRITDISYGVVNNYTTITISATDISYGTGVKIGDRNISRIDYINSNQIQAMIETSLMTDSFWNNPQDLTLKDTSGNEYVYYNLISYGSSKPYFTNSNEYIGSFSAGDSINFTLPINNSTSIMLGPAYAGETAISWLSVSGSSIVGSAPPNSSPSRYEISVTASNGGVNITKNYWLLVV